MDDRTHHERQIKRIDPRLGRRFEEALSMLAFHNGLSWFTDDQIAEIRDAMISAEWRRNRRQMESRASYRVALESRQTKETA